MANEARAQQPVIAAGLVPEGLSRGGLAGGSAWLWLSFPRKRESRKKVWLVKHMVDSAGMIRMEWEVPSKTDIESSQE